MLASKSRSGASEIPHRTSPATPKVSKQPRGAAPASDNPTTPASQSGRTSVDKFSKLPNRRSPSRSITVPEKRVVVSKGAELQQQLNQAQEELKKAREQVRVAERAKEQSQRAAEEANAKLSEALVAQKRAQERSESDKFRADEVEQASIEVSQRREEAWRCELEEVQKQHAVDVSALISATQELHRVKHDLSIAMDSKAAAVKLAEEAAEANARRANDLSSELETVKESLDAAYASKISAEDEKASANAELEREAASAAKANQELQSLKRELGSVKDLESQLAEAHALVEKLASDVQNCRDSESKAVMLAREETMKVERAEKEVERAREAENKAFGSLMSATAELEEANMALEKANADSASFSEMVDSLRSELDRTKIDLKDADTRLEKAKAESASISESVDLIKFELANSQADLVEAKKQERLALSRVSELTEELNAARDELQEAIVAEEKSKKAMDDLALALHEVTGEAGDAKLEAEAAREDARAASLEAERWKAALEDRERKYQAVLDEARSEAEEARQEAERAQLEVEESMAAWNERESKLVECIRQAELEANAAREDVRKLLDCLQEAESEATAAKEEINRLLIALEESESDGNRTREDVNKLSESLRQAKEEANAYKNNAQQLSDSLKEVEAEAFTAKEDAESARVEIAIVKDALLDRENELQSIVQENEDLKASEAAALEQVEELKVASSQKSAETSVAKEEYKLLQRKVQEAEENANQRIADALAQVVAANMKENEMGKKLKATSLELENLRQKLNESSEDLDAARIANLAMEADLKKSREEEEQWKKAAGTVSATVSRNGEMNGKTVDRLASSQEHLPLETFGSVLNGRVSSPVRSEDFDPVETAKSEEIDHFENPTNKKKKAMLRKFGDLLKKKSQHK